MKTMKETTVKPAEATRRRSIPLTLLDRVFVLPRYTPIVLIYRPTTTTTKECTAELLAAALSKTLVSFYPLAGRCTLVDNAAMEIECNDQGVPFVVAETDSCLKDLGDLAPSSNMSAILPRIVTTQDISSSPLMAVQVTYFKCCGVSVAVSTEHHCLDGTSFFHVMKSWSEIYCGLEISTPPFLDRTIIYPRDPPQPKFDHQEYTQYAPDNRISNNSTNGIKTSVFRLTSDQLHHMKSECGHHYSTFEVLVAHIWKCVCTAREIGAGEETRLMFPADTRRRWKPRLPRGFFGSAIVRVLSVAQAGDLESEPLGYAAAKIHKAVVRVDDEYLRSTMDYLVLLPDDLAAAKTGPQRFYAPNFQITSWANLGTTDADFGLGVPIYSGPGSIMCDKAYIFPSDSHSGGLSVVIALCQNT